MYLFCGLNMTWVRLSPPRSLCIRALLQSIGSTGRLSLLNVASRATTVVPCSTNMQSGRQLWGFRKGKRGKCDTDRQGHSSEWRLCQAGGEDKYIFRRVGEGRDLKDVCLLFANRVLSRILTMLLLLEIGMCF